jgi:Ankyrin repeats (3 copies)/Ankyrin repeat
LIWLSSWPGVFAQQVFPNKSQTYQKRVFIYILKMLLWNRRLSILALALAGLITCCFITFAAAKQCTGMESLVDSAMEGNVDIVTCLLDEGADINVKNKNGWTALMEAAYNDHDKVVQLLVDKGADMNVEDKDGVSALSWATHNGHDKVVQVLVDKGADMNIRSKDGDTALMYAAYMDLDEVVQVLVDKGADMNIKDKDGKTALMHAKGRAKEILSALTMHGVRELF